MRKPRGVDILAFFIEKIEYNSADIKTCKREENNADMKPSDHHSRVIERECKRAEAIREFAGGQTLERLDKCFFLFHTLTPSH